MIALKKAATAGVMCALLLVAPATASAQGTVTVEVAYGGVAVCGVGIFFYFAGSWEIPFVPRALQGALLELGAGRARLGVPLPSLHFDADSSGEPVAHDAIHFDLLRWRF